MRRHSVGPPIDKIAPGLTHVSIDLYAGFDPDHNSFDGAVEANETGHFLRHYVFPRMQQGQLALLVPGTFACSNFSFLYVTVTFATMVKPCGLLWTCALAICLGLEKATPTLIAVVLCIFLGVFLASFGETAFSLPGFVLVILSTLFSAVRWVLTQSMLNSALKSGESTALGQKDAGLFSSGPVVLLYLISPSAAISLIPLMVRPAAVL